MDFTFSPSCNTEAAPWEFFSRERKGKEWPKYRYGFSCLRVRPVWFFYTFQVQTLVS